MGSLVSRILVLTAKAYMQSEVTWDADLNFAIKCDDLFSWGSADVEEVTLANIGLLEATVFSLDDDAECFAGALFCCISRGMRPQGAMYKHLPEHLWILFDACGPLRPTGLGNPHKHPSEV